MNRINHVLACGAAAVGALIAFSLIYIAVASWRAGARLDRHITAIRAAGDPVTLAELARKPIPPEQNAAVYLRRAEKSLTAVGQELQPLYRDRAHHYRNGRLTESGATIVKSALDAYPDILPLIEQAAACGDYDPQHDFTVSPGQFTLSSPPHMQSNRQIASILNHRVELLLPQGDGAEALRTCLLMLRLGRHFDQEPIMNGHLISIAVQDMAISATSRVLVDGPVSSNLRQQLKNELAGHDGLAGYRRALTTERAFGIESFRELTGGYAFLVMWNFKRDMCDYAQQLDREIKLGSLPPHELDSDAESQARATNVEVLTASVMPVLVAHREAFQRVRARLQCLRVLNAVQVYIETTDVRDPSIADLKLADELTVDPYDGRPLRMKKAPAGWTIYSVGKNRKDDGGKFDDAEDIGVGPVASRDSSS